MTDEHFNHPLSGLILPKTLSNLEAADADTRDVIGKLYRRLDKEVTPFLSELRGPTKFPRKSQQTDTQRRATKCPRCAQFYEEAK